MNRNAASKDELEKRLKEFADGDEEEMDCECPLPHTKSKLKVTFPKEQLKRIRVQWKGYS